MIASVEWGDSVLLIEGGRVKPFEPMRGRDRVDWSSSDSSVATVDSDGQVTGVEPGTAIIRVRADGIDDSAVVVVESPNGPDTGPPPEKEDSLTDGKRVPEPRADDRRGVSPPPAPVQINVTVPERSGRDFVKQALLAIIATGANMVAVLVLLFIAKRRGLKGNDLMDLLG